MMTKAFDVVAVGCGVAGLAAAVSAAENGARVALLERATALSGAGRAAIPKLTFA